MARPRWWLALVASTWATAAAVADSRGAGSSKPAWTPPVTKSTGTAPEASDLRAPGTEFDRGLGMFGGLGAGKDQLGPWRLGRYGVRSVTPWYGEAAPQGFGSSYEPWKSGDLVRSTSAADVRSARMQQAPDLEWQGAPNRGEETYGKQFQHAQEKSRR